jgi:hypothetical protein
MFKVNEKYAIEEDAKTQTERYEIATPEMVYLRVPIDVDNEEAYRGFVSSAGSIWTFQDLSRVRDVPEAHAERFVIYDTTTVSDDVKEIMIVAHRTEGKVDEILNLLKNTAEKNEESDNKDTECLDIADEDASAMIIEYMKEHSRAWPQDISLELRLDFEQVMRITRKLLDEGVLNDSDKEAEKEETTEDSSSRCG